MTRDIFEFQLFLFWLWLLFSCCAAITHRHIRSSCVPSFHENRAFFDVCKTEVCFVFRSEKPFIIMDSTLTSSEPFRCRDREKFYPMLSGIFFDILHEMSQLGSAWCTWSGPDCTFDDLVMFVDQSDKAGGYNFVAGGLLFNLNYRMSNTSIPSVPLLQDELVVVGPRKTVSTIDSLLSPFSARVWGFLMCLFCLALGLRILISWSFARKRFWQHLFGEYNDKTPFMLRYLNRYWSCGFMLSLSILILYYETAVTHFVWDVPPKKRLESWNRNENGEQLAIAHIRNTTQQFVLGREMARTKSISFDFREDLYRELLTGDTVKFVIDYNLFHKHFLGSSNAWTKFTEYTAFESIPPSDAVWYFSQHVPFMQRLAINREIIQLRMSGRLNDIVDRSVGPSNSKWERPLAINRTMFLPLYVWFGTLLCIVLSYNLFCAPKSIRQCENLQGEFTN